MKCDITAVLAANRNLPLLKAFLVEFRKYFPTVPLVVSCLQASSEILKYLESLQDLNLKIVTGTPKDGHRCSFSELYNAGINAVETRNLVLIHTDMIFDRYFFENLDKDLATESFLEYCVVEPLECWGHRRPGKFICSLGDSFQTFDRSGFEKCCKDIQQGINFLPGRGFFLAGTREAFEDVGGFDQITFNPVFCEDDDICLRIVLRGYKIKTDRNAVAYHFGSQTSRTMRKEISDEELRSNRKFAQKWGFEVRVLNDSGYEVYDGLQIRKWKIGGKNLDDQLKNCLEGLTGTYQDCSTLSREVDIVVEGTGKDYNIHQFLKVLGSIGLTQQPLKVGEYNYPGFKVNIRRSEPETFREDNQNYLLLQRTTEYE